MTTGTECLWKEAADFKWKTDCDHNVDCLNHTSPVEFGMEFCCFCGQRLIQEKFGEAKILGGNDEE